MKQTFNILRGRPLRPAQHKLCLMLLAALFAWLLPQTAAASYEEEPDNYSVSLGGTTTVYFTAPVYSQEGADTWIYDGNLRVSVDGGEYTTIFHWASETDIDSDKSSLSCYFSTTANGFFDITLGNTTSTSRLTKDNPGNRTLQRNSDGYSYSFEAEWSVPYNLLGKTLKFQWYCKRNGNSATVRDREVENLKVVTVKMPEASAKLTPFISTPMMDPNSPGKLQLPWFLASDSITKAYYEYVDAMGKYHKEDLSDMNSGIIILDANVPHKSLRLVCDYKAQGDKGSYLIEGVSSSPQNVPLIHGPPLERPQAEGGTVVERAFS